MYLHLSWLQIKWQHKRCLLKTANMDSTVLSANMSRWQVQRAKTCLHSSAWIDLLLYCEKLSHVHLKDSLAMDQLTWQPRSTITSEISSTTYSFINLN